MRFVHYNIEPLPHFRAKVPICSFNGKKQIMFQFTFLHNTLKLSCVNPVYMIESKRLFPFSLFEELFLFITNFV